MAKIRFAYACSFASLATVLLGSVAVPQFAVAQTAAVTNSNTATATDSSANRRGPVDPGVRGGDPGAGGPLPGLSPEELAFFEASREFFAEVEGIPDGLGPRLNLDGCASCHVHPVVGGTSPAINPQVAFATSEGKRNIVPPFITENGPIREARFVRNRDGSPDGAVHQLFVITGHADAAGCNIRQPDFAAELARNNVIFRIPTPVFGLGLVEGVTDASLAANLAANANQKRSLGISGRLNRNPNDGTTTRFGWKAQNKSLLLFAGEAYNVEQGITSELFPQEVELDPNCDFAPDPDSPTPLTPADPDTGSPSANFQSDIIMFAAFMRLIGPAIPALSCAGLRSVLPRAATDIHGRGCQGPQGVVRHLARPDRPRDLRPEHHGGR